MVTLSPNARSTLRAAGYQPMKSRRGGWPRSQRRYRGLDLLRSLEVRAASARSVARVTRRPLVVGVLGDLVDWPLVGVHVVQPVEGTDRVGVFERSGLVARPRERLIRRSRRTGYLASQRGTSRQG